jgi:hypothetical protein
MKPIVSLEFGFVSAAQMWEGRMNGATVVVAASCLRKVRRLVCMMFSFC